MDKILTNLQFFDIYRIKKMENLIGTDNNDQYELRDM
jgi:hypothetical protein